MKHSVDITHVEHFQIPARFRGPPRSGNGGYTCGRMAVHLDGPVRVRLKAPPPLETGLRLESTAREARLFDDATLLGEASATTLDLEVPPCPTRAQADAAVADYPGFRHHLFPGCFVCGPARGPGDGLRIFPGAVGGTATLAAPWTPDAGLADGAGHVRPEFLWAALDCPGAFALFPLPEDTALVLGELAASISGVVSAGERCIVIGWPLGTDGRKRFAGTAIYREDGNLAACARAVWIEVPLGAWH